MKRPILLLMLFSLFAILLLPTDACAQPDYLRLHIIANSDTLIDQSVKLGVRDAVREYTSQLMSQCKDADEAWELLKTHESALLDAARSAAAQYGFDEPVALEMGVFPFPDRLYGDEHVPAGEYRAVRITLGKGAGRNWWCVVYPSLCLPSDADLSQPVEFYSSICRWALRLREVLFG